MSEEKNLNIQTKEQYKELLNKTISYYETLDPNSYILQQLLDIKKYIVEQRIYQCMDIDDIWDDVDQKYSFGGYAVKNLEEDSDESETLCALFDGAINYEILTDDEEYKDLRLRKTYLNNSVKNGHLIRWNKNQIPVYIPPIENNDYNKIIINAFNEWADATNGVLTFKYVNESIQNGINIIIKKFDKKDLSGYYKIDYTENFLIYSSRIELCLPNLLLYKKYTGVSFYNTLLPIIGKILGLSSPYSEDITSSYKQYFYDYLNYVRLSARDKLSIKCLYSIPKNMSIREFAISKNLSPDLSIDDIIARLDERESIVI